MFLKLHLYFQMSQGLLIFSQNTVIQQAYMDGFSMVEAQVRRKLLPLVCFGSQYWEPQCLLLFL